MLSLSKNLDEKLKLYRRNQLQTSNQIISMVDNFQIVRTSGSVLSPNSSVRQLVCCMTVHMELNSKFRFTCASSFTYRRSSLSGNEYLKSFCEYVCDNGAIVTSLIKTCEHLMCPFDITPGKILESIEAVEKFYESQNKTRLCQECETHIEKGAKICPLCKSTELITVPAAP